MPCPPSRPAPPEPRPLRLSRRPARRTLPPTRRRPLRRAAAESSGSAPSPPPCSSLPVGRSRSRTPHKTVTLDDGVEEARRAIGDAVTTPLVTAVVGEGTRPRPASSGGAVVTGDVWGALAQCESGGNPAAVSSNGLYYGLYQFSLGTWGAMGGSGLPSNASPAEQLQRAQALQARSGWG